MLTFRPVHGGDEGELWGRRSWTRPWTDGWAGRGEGRGIGRARRFPKERRCRCAAGQRAGRAGAGEGGELTPSLLPSSKPSRWRAYFFFGILRICTQCLISFLEYFVSALRIRRREAAAESPPE
eukprot:813786-Prymnesium_polylepis.1